MPDAADEKATSTASNRLIKRHFRLVLVLDPYAISGCNAAASVRRAVSCDHGTDESRDKCRKEQLTGECLAYCQ